METENIPRDTKSQKAAELQDFSTLKSQIIERCSAAKLEYKESESIELAPRLTIYLPAGRSNRAIVVSDNKSAKQLLNVLFENYVFLGSYLAICSYKSGFIEAVIRSASMMLISPVLERLLGRNRERTVELKRSEGGERITLAPMSQDLRVLCNRPFGRASIKISGLNISQHDEALAYLEKLSNAAFFKIDMLMDAPLALMRERRSARPLRPRKPFDIQDIEFPQNQYDQEAISLYWYARSARGMPLLQFLAFYQSIEFYFPVYSQVEASRKVRNILKDPTFNAHRDSDVGKLLAAIKAGVGKGFGDERAQLRATLQESLDPDAIREFLTADNSRRDFFTSKSKSVSDRRLPIANPTADLRNDIADRIYDIRCKIVHTKTGGGEGEVELLLPFSKEADLLDYEIELIQYVSQQVLIAGSSPLTI